MEKNVHADGNCTRKIEIKVPSEEIEKKYNSMLDGLSQKVEIPGFRHGKAPRQMLEKRYKDVLLEDMTDELLQTAYKEAIAENNLIPLVPPELDGEPQLVVGEDFTATIVVDVKPEVVLREYKGIPLTRKIDPVTEDDVEMALKELLRRAGRLEPVSGRKSINGDYAFVEFQPNGAEAPIKQVLVLDDISTSALIGINIDDYVEGHFDFPVDYPDRDLAGNAYDAKAKILELKELVPAELDQDFLSRFGEEVIDEAALREGIKKDLAENRKGQSDKDIRRQARIELASRNHIELTEKIIDRAVVGTMSSYWKIEDLSEEQIKEIKANLRPNTIRSMIVDFVIEEIAKAEKIEVSEEEIKERIAEIAKANRLQPDSLYRHWKKEGKIDDVRDDIIAEKTIELIVDNAIINEE